MANRELFPLHPLHQSILSHRGWRLKTESIGDYENIRKVNRVHSVFGRLGIFYNIANLIEMGYSGMQYSIRFIGKRCSLTLLHEFGRIGVRDIRCPFPCNLWLFCSRMRGALKNGLNRWKVPGKAPLPAGRFVVKSLFELRVVHGLSSGSGHAILSLGV